MSVKKDGGMILTGETEELRKTCPSATLSTTNPTWIDPGSNPGLCGERPATNRLSHGTALVRLEWNRFDINFKAPEIRNGFLRIKPFWKKTEVTKKKERTSNRNSRL
jgi:hypothetical protein